ncbi:Galactinol synthase 1 [Hondaea fermentalgiana]|uniref:Galactinol synthase 1 n=1 Tax=Hondaea fermentalgiana TaxID=2315210 RepID=A0A2R5GIG7_9STRA|nr:Galactinol synthase 1 [Hondaea fermentalgiana]|eukprot:GBG30109.1 Galactinol synthase 1 [Hondaea fermentalgiana]
MSSLPAPATGSVTSAHWITLLDGTVRGTKERKSFKRHMVSKFTLGKIPWENMGIIVAPGAPKNAFPEFREWLVARGGHAIEVDPLLCEGGNKEKYKYQFTKLKVWSLPYDVIVYTDLDTLVTGDISKLWSSCISGVHMCGVEEEWQLPGEHYFNGGMFVARPNDFFYQEIINGYEKWDGWRGLCEQEFLNRYLKPERIGTLDGKYNVMSFSSNRKQLFLDAKLIHYDMIEIDGLYHKTTIEERDYVHAMIDRVKKFGERYPNPKIK